VYQEGTAALVLLPTLVFLHPVALWQPRTLVLLVALGLVCTALAHTLFIYGLGNVSAVTASLLASLEPVWGIAFALVLLGERPSTRTLVGGAVIVAATALPAAWDAVARAGAAPQRSPRSSGSSGI
jgi:drug/metabolite transporter (DMT)-like permease